MNTTNICPTLTFGNVGGIQGSLVYASQSLFPTVNVPIYLTATVGNNGPCPRSGAIQFGWLPFGWTTPIPLSLTAAVYASNGGQRVAPGQFGVATATWQPTANCLTGLPVAVGQIIGTPYAPDFDPCGNCNGTPTEAGATPPDCVGMTTALALFANPPMAAQARVDRASAAAPLTDTEYLGFAVVRAPEKTKLMVSAFRKFAAEADFVVPDASVFVADPQDKYGPRVPFSGPLGPKSDIDLNRKFERVADVSAACEGEPMMTQGLLKLVWPQGSAGKRTLIEFAQFGAEKRARAHCLGLRHVADPAFQVWL